MEVFQGWYWYLQKKYVQKVQEEASLNIGQPNNKLKGALTSSKAEERKISSTSLIIIFITKLLIIEFQI